MPDAGGDATDDAAPPPEDAGSDAGPRDWPPMTVPSSDEPAEGVVREVFTVAGSHPAANPMTGDETPTELDHTTVVRYRAAGAPSARSVIVAMPGLLAGAGTWQSLAIALVQRGASGGGVEVWAIDRRGNLLEDHRGTDTAEAAQDAEIAQGYYFGGDTIGGVAFEGLRTQGELGYLSEWGLATHVEDVRRVIALVPEASRRGHVFLMGHSMGGTFTRAYAAWRFEDGTRGVDELAGLIVVDGGGAAAGIDEEEYRAGGGGIGALTNPGLDRIRERTRFLELPILGASALVRLHVIALRALYAPTEIIEDDPGRDRLSALLLSLGDDEVPLMTNRAVLGFALDDASSAVTFAACALGSSSGGPLGQFTSPFGGATLLQPTDPEATYDWVDALDAEPAEWTPIELLARSASEGRTDFTEWYFPLRLPLDLGAVGDGNLPEDGYFAAQGIRAFDGELVDAPLLAISSELVSVESYEAVGPLLAPIGEGRPAAGAGRDDERAFRVLDVPSMTHVDPLTAADRPENPVPDAITEFLAEHSEEGTVAVPTMEESR